MTQLDDGNLWGKKCWNWSFITLNYFILKYEGEEKTLPTCCFLCVPSIPQRAKCIKIYLIGKKPGIWIKSHVFHLVSCYNKMPCLSLRCSGSLAWLRKVWYLIKNVTLCAVIVTSCHGGAEDWDRMQQSCHRMGQPGRDQGLPLVPPSLLRHRIASRHFWNILSPPGLIWTAQTWEIRDVCGWPTLLLLLSPGKLHGSHIDKKKRQFLDSAF